jgi:hypothetical protein
VSGGGPNLWGRQMLCHHHVLVGVWIKAATCVKVPGLFTDSPTCLYIATTHAPLYTMSVCADVVHIRNIDGIR